MTVLRAIAGIIVGYLVYAVASMLLVGAAMSSQGPAIVVVALIALALIGALAGFMAAKVGGPKGRLAVWVAAGLVTLATVANLALGAGAEPAWYKLGTLVLTAPALVLIGLRFSADG